MRIKFVHNSFTQLNNYTKWPKYCIAAHQACKIHILGLLNYNKIDLIKKFYFSIKTSHLLVTRQDLHVGVGGSWDTQVYNKTYELQIQEFKIYAWKIDLRH